MDDRRSSVLAFVIGAMWAASLVTLVVVRAGDISGLIHAGGVHVDPAALPEEVILQPADQSYDGQFFYRQAVAPWSNSQWEQGIRFDAPSLRATRVIYPVLAFVASGGGTQGVPYALVLVNVLAAGAVAVGGSRLARSLGKPWYVGLIFLLIPSVTFGLALDLADVVALAFVLFALNDYLRERWLLTGALLSLAALSRESTLVVPLCIWLSVGYEMFNGRSRPNWQKLVGLSLPFAVAASWQLVILLRWGEVGMLSSGDGNFGPPFGGFVSTRSGFVPTDGSGAVRLFVLCLIIAVAISAVVAAARAHEPIPLLVIGIVVTVLLVISLNEVSLANYPNFGRASTELLVFSTLLALSVRRRQGYVPLVALGLGGAVLAGWTVWATTPLTA